MREFRFDLSIQGEEGPRGDEELNEIRPDESRRKQLLFATVLALAGAYILEARPIGPAAASADPAFIDFASAPRLHPTVRSVTIKSTGQSPLRVGQVAVRGPNSDEFPIASDGCTNAVLMPGESCSVDVQFLRQGRAEARADLVVSDDTGSGPVVIGLRGDSIAPGISRLVPQPRTIEFGDVDLKMTSAVQRLTLSARGDEPVRIDRIASQDAEFRTSTDQCSGKTLQAGQSCQVGVTFVPQDEGIRSSRIDVVPHASVPPVSVTVIGKGINRPDLAVAPGLLVFGQTTVGEKETHPILVTPGGRLALRFARARLSGLNSNEFRILEDGCRGASLTSTVTCKIRVEFKPRQAGQRVAAIHLEAEQDHHVRTLATVEVQGEAVERSALVLTPDHLSFANDIVTPVPVPQEVTVLKRGPGSIVVGRAEILDGHGLSAHLGQGNQSRDFTATNPCEGKTLNQGDTCTIEVRFVRRTGQGQAILAVSASNQSPPMTVTLDGSGPSEPLGWCCINGGLRSMTESACRSVQGGVYYRRDDQTAQGKCVIIK